MIPGPENCYVPTSSARALAQAIPGARLRVLEGTGHLVFFESATDVNGEVLAFLGETSRV